MTQPKEFKKPVGATLNYGVNLKEWLAEGDSIESAEIEIVGESTLTIVESAAQIDGTVIYNTFRGGVQGDRTVVRVTWTTAKGLTDTWRFIIEVNNRW